MKTSQKAVLAFVITAISTLSGETGSWKIQALLDETYVPAAAISFTGLTLTHAAASQDSRPGQLRSTPETGNGPAGLKNHRIVPVADTQSQPVR